MNKRDYYEILGVSKSATQDEIKSSFRKLAKQYHPDVNKEANSSDKFKEAQEAYAVLSDSEKRQQYDQYGHAAFQNNGGGNGAGGYDFSNFDFSDIFGEMFGNSFGFGSRGQNSNRHKKGRDTLLHLNLSFEDAVFGTKKEIKLDVTENCDECDGNGGHGEHTCSRCRGSGYVTVEQRTLFGAFMTKSVCPECSGTGKTYERICTKCRGQGKVKRNKTIEVTIPAGVNTGNQLRIANKGEAGVNGGPNGDIYLEFTVLEHPIYERDENDIYLKLPITITDAVLGCKKDIPTLYGTVKLTIPVGSANNDRHRLKGKGVADVNNGHKGDMYVILNVIIPKKLSKAQKQLFDSLATTDLEDDNDFKKIRKYV